MALFKVVCFSILVLQCSTLSLDGLNPPGFPVALPTPRSVSDALWGLPPLHMLHQGNTEHKSTRIEDNKTPTSSHLAAFQSSELPTPSVMSTVVVPMVAGGMATAVGDLAVHPFDTIKTMTQSTITGEASTFSGAVSKVLRESGPVGLYAGVGPFVLFDGLSGCIKFAVYEMCKQVSAKRVPEEYQELSNFVSAAVAFIACSVVLVPGELFKVKLQAQLYPGVRACVAGIWKEGGPKAMFQGYKEILVRDVPYTMLELGLYDSVKGLLQRLSSGGEARRGGSDQRNEIVAAALVGGLVGFVTNPLDVLKTRMMISSSAAPPRMWALTKSIWKEGGMRSFLGGSTARVAWLMPFTAVYLPAYDFFKRELNKLGEVMGERKATLLKKFNILTHAFNAFGTMDKPFADHGHHATGASADGISLTDTKSSQGNFTD